MPLSSNRRQDYEHSRWHLGNSVSEFLTLSPEHGTRAVIDAVIGKTRTQGHDGAEETDVVNVGSAEIEFRGVDLDFNAWDEKDDDLPTSEHDVLVRYAAFLRSCDVASFGSSVAAASRDYAAASVWKRILGVASERVAELGDLIWPTMTKPDLLANGRTQRDAIRFVAAAWPSRSHEERCGFEQMVLDDTRHGDDDARRDWRRILEWLLALLPEETLVLEPTRRLRRQMQAEGQLLDDQSIHRSSSHWGGRQGYVRDGLRQEGVDMDGGPNRVVMEASDALHASVNATPSDSDATKLASLWLEATALLALLDANPGLLDRVDHSAWGHLSNAVERVASSPNFTPGADGLPDLDTLLTVLARLSASKYPEPRGNGA